MEWILGLAAAIVILLVVSWWYSRKHGSGVGDESYDVRTDQLGKGGPQSGGGRARGL